MLTLFGLILLFSSFYIVPEGYVGTISRLGKFQDQVAMPGFHFKIPFVDRVYLDDVKMQTANYSGKSDEEDKDGIIDKAMLDILDANNVVYHIELTLQFTPIAERMPEIRRIYGANYFDKKINAIVRDAVRDVGGKYVVETVASNREAIDAAIEEALREEFKDLPFILNDASLRQIVLPPDVQAKIKEVQLAKQEEERLKIVVRREEQNKAILETKAAAEKAQKIIQAEAEAAKKKLVADAEAYRIATESAALAKANERLAASLTPLLVEHERIQKWDDVLPTHVLGSQTSTLLNVAGK